jgi:hypothetical protein
VWAGATVLGAVIALGGIGAAANMAGSALATATTATATVAEGTGNVLDPNAYYADQLFRAEQPVAGNAEARGEATRILAQAALGDGSIPEADRTYLANVVAANTGLTPEESAARVSQVVVAIDGAKQQALEAARIARNTAIIAAFLLAATTLVSAISAFWAAQKGGNHRDENTVFTDVFRRF